MKKAVTLIELIIVILITGVVMVGLASYLTQAVATWDFLSYRSDVVNEVRLGLVRMGRDIRDLTGISTNCTGCANGICFNNATIFEFCRPDGSGNETRMRYRYDPASGMIFYEESSSLVSFNANVSAPAMGDMTGGTLFTYYDANMNVNSNSIRCVNIGARLQNRGQTMNADYLVCPRNLGQ
jgi:hypothetical protein